MGAVGWARSSLEISSWLNSIMRRLELTFQRDVIGHELENPEPKFRIGINLVQQRNLLMPSNTQKILTALSCLKSCAGKNVQLPPINQLTAFIATPILLNEAKPDCPECGHRVVNGMCTNCPWMA